LRLREFLWRFERVKIIRGNILINAVEGKGVEIVVSIEKGKKNGKFS